jgi:cell division septation protein DedD
MLNPLPYINLPSDNGGIVLDVSEDGLRFRATSQIQPFGPSPFWFTAHSNRIEGQAELIWLDRAGKTGGLRFTELSATAREHIRSWPGDPNLRPSIGEDFALHIYAPEAPTPRWKWDWRAAFVPVAAVATRAGVHLKSLGTKIESALLPMMQSGRSELRELRPQEFVRQSGPRILRVAGGVVLGIVVLTLALTHRQQEGKSLIWLGMELSGPARTASPVRPTSAQAPPAAPAENLLAAKPAIDAAELPAALALAAPVPASPQAASVPATLAVNAAASAAVSVPLAPVPVAESPRPGLAASDTELLVQVAALTEESGARDLAESLRRENFPASVRVLPVDSLYRVVLGPFTDKVPALSARGKLKRAGFHAFIRREPAAEFSDLRTAKPASF